MNRKERRGQRRLATSGPSSSAEVTGILFAQACSHYRTGDLATADRLLKHLLTINRYHADATNLLGGIACRQGRLIDAAGFFETSIQLDGSQPRYYLDLATVHGSLDNDEAAVRALRSAIELRPEYGEAHALLGELLRKQGLLEASVDSYAAAVRLQPGSAATWSNYGVTLRDLGRVAEALAAQARAIAIDATIPEIQFNFGNALRAAGHLDKAAQAYRRSLLIKPGFAAARCNLGYTLADMGQVEDARRTFLDVIERAPETVEAHLGLGNALAALGRFDEAERCYQAAISRRPAHAEAHSNILLNQHYRMDLSPRERLARARAYAGQFEVMRTSRHVPMRAEAERLRVGYISGDFCRHPVGFFFRPVIMSHDVDAVETFCFNNGRAEDEITQEIRGAACHWRDVTALTDAQTAALIAEDQIDILVDLSGHTARNRLRAFAGRSAPVQVTWLGYWDTTGLSSMDYIMSDGFTIRSGEEDLYTEKVVRLPQARFCYSAPEYAPANRPPPLLDRGMVTFGSFNNLAKAGPEVIRIWADILRAVPNSKILLKWKSAGDPSVRERYIAAFVAAGVDPARVELRPGSPHPEMLEQYGDVDIALDPFPFSGCLTTCEALWMGVPVVTLPGGAPASRQSVAFLHMSGLADLVAASASDYVRIAVRLAQDRPRLQELRTGLRGRMRASPLSDGKAFTRAVETIYREMWRATCEAPTAPP